MERSSGQLDGYQHPVQLRINDEEDSPARPANHRDGIGIQRYYMRIDRGDAKLYVVDADTIENSIIKIMEAIGDPDTWPATWPHEFDLWTIAYYHDRYGEPSEAIEL